VYPAGITSKLNHYPPSRRFAAQRSEGRAQELAPFSGVPAITAL